MGFTLEASETGRYREADVKRVYGHIDTGCDCTAVEESLLGGVALKPRRSISVTTVNSFAAADVHRATLLFFGPYQNLAQDTEFAAVPATNNPYKIILGRSFLQQARFTYNGAKGIDMITITKAEGPTSLSS